jgi:signal transduction histidine kinase
MTIRARLALWSAARFHRRERDRARASGGFGLGLAIADAIARGHGGTLTVMARDQGGLTVTATLPAFPAH